MTKLFPCTFNLNSNHFETLKTQLKVFVTLLKIAVCLHFVVDLSLNFFV